MKFITRLHLVLGLRMLVAIPLLLHLFALCDYSFNSTRTFIIHKGKSNKMQQCIRILLFHIYSSTRFGRHTAHHQEPKTALAASGFSYMEGCSPCGWWSASTNHTVNNLPCMKNQRLPVQF